MRSQLPGSVALLERRLSSGVAEAGSKRAKAEVASPGHSFYLANLEGLRFFAFFGVFLHHLPRSQFSPLLANVQERGGIGVQVFFALSAFLLFSLAILEGSPASGPNYARFMVRRMLRILPLLATFVAIALTVALLFHSVAADYAIARAIGAVLFVDNFMCWFVGFSRLPYTAHLWTLSYEMQFYPLIPLFAAAALARRHVFWSAVTLAFVVAIAIRISFLMLGAPRLAVATTPFIFPDSVLMGLLLGFFFWRRTNVPLWLGTLVSVAMIGLYFSVPFVINGPRSFMLYLLLAGASGGILWASLYLEPLRWFLSQEPIVFLGKISYGLYVFHYPVIAICNRMAIEYGYQPMQQAAHFASYFALTLAITIVLSALSWHLLERPFLRLKRRFEIVSSRPT